MVHYNYHLEHGERSARAQVHDADASYKDLTQICRAIRYRSAKDAERILADAMEKKRAIPYVRHGKGTGHRSDLGGRRGRYPVKECRVLLGVLHNALANAASKGLDENKLVVASCAAYKQNVLRRYRRTWVGGVVIGYGRQATWANYTTARAELTLVEREPNPAKAKKARGKPAGAPTAGAGERTGKAAGKAAAEQSKKPMEAK